MVNATEMAKPFGKKVTHFLENNQTKDFIEALSLSRNSDFGKFVIIQRGGSNPGTWMHEDVAIEFSRWLSPAFAIWCNDRIKELLRYGITATQPTIENILADPDTGIRLLTELKKEREEKAALQKANAKLQTRSDFVDLVFGTDGLIAMSQVAKVLALSYGRNTLFAILREKGILFKSSNEPKQQHVSSGYFTLRERSINRHNHPPKIVTQTFVTQKGLAYIAKTIGAVNHRKTRRECFCVRQVFLLLLE